MTFFKITFIDIVRNNAELKNNYSKIKKEVHNFWKDKDTESEEEEESEEE